MTDLTKPEIDFPEGPAPTDLVIRDIVVGEGTEAVPGARVTVHYLGVEYDTGDQFDASWDRGESITFPLSGLIQGWQDGIPGEPEAPVSSLPSWAWTPAERRP